MSRVRIILELRKEVESLKIGSEKQYHKTLAKVEFSKSILVSRLFLSDWKLLRLAAYFFIVKITLLIRELISYR